MKREALTSQGPLVTFSRLPLLLSHIFLSDANAIRLVLTIGLLLIGAFHNCIFRACNDDSQAISRLYSDKSRQAITRACELLAYLREHKT
jgi:hypothetical protein